MGSKLTAPLLYSSSFQISIREAIPKDAVYATLMYMRAVGKEFNVFKESTKVTLHENPMKEYEKQVKQQITERMKNILKYSQDDNALYLVAEFRGKIIGFCAATKEGDYATLGGICIEPAFRKMGIAKLLLKKIIEWVPNKDIHIWVTDCEANRDTIKSYKRLGFAETGKKEEFEDLKTKRTFEKIELKRSMAHNF